MTRQAAVRRGSLPRLRRALTPGRAAAVLILFLAALLAVDQFVELRGQYLLGALTWAALILALVCVPPLLRAQALIVVVVATSAELIGSIIWGVYSYRLDNLPTCVPPAHGLVYLAGVMLSRSLGRHETLLVRTALVAVLAWGLAGVTVLPRMDVGGALGAVLLAIFLLRGRSPAIYAGVFLVVAALELYGTAIGTWQWAETIPGTGIPNGNPPSGVASGYVWFDVIAIALAPYLLAAARRAREAISRQPPSRFRTPALPPVGSTASRQTVSSASDTKTL